MSAPSSLAEILDSLTVRACALSAEIKVQTGQLTLSQIADASALAAARTAAVACHAQLRFLAERARSAATTGEADG